MNQSFHHNNAHFTESESFKEILNEIQVDANLRRANGGAAPFETIEKLKKFKIGALRIPVEYGGKGLSITELFQVIIEISTIDPDIAQIFRSHFQFVEDLLRSNDVKFKDDWLAKVVQGVITGNAFAEINNITVGSGKFQTSLTPFNDHFLLNGKKFFTTGTLYADYVIVRVGSDKGQAFNVIIPRDREGVQVLDDWDGMGQCYTASGTTLFTDVHVFQNEIICVAAEQVKFKPFTQLYLHAIIAGILKNVQTDAVTLLTKRSRTFSFASHQTPTEDPVLLQIIGNISANAYLAEAIVLKAAQAQDVAFNATYEGVTNFELAHQAALEATQVKIALEPIALATASQLFDVTSASSTRKSLELDRHWRNIRTLCSHNPASFKATVIGDLLVNDKKIPNNPYF